MTKKEAQKAVTRLSKDLRALVDVNPDCLIGATVMVHHIPEDKMPTQFKKHMDWGEYRTYEVTDREARYNIKAFTEH